MNEKHNPEKSHPRDLLRHLARRVDRKRQRPDVRGLWAGLGMMGIIGWSVAIPTLLGAISGWWVDGLYPGGRSWTLLLLIAGLVLGCYNAWHWIAREEREIREQEKHDE